VKRTKSKTKPTALVTFLLDRSGSMASCRDVTIEAFNGYLSGLKEETEADFSFTLLQFDTASLDKCCVNAPVRHVPELTTATYQPRGGTPLIDAAVKTIRAVEGALATRDDKPKVVICIQTDGHENASNQHTWEELRGLVSQKTDAGWEFNFMGAGIEGYDQAARMGIVAMNTVSYDSTDRGATQAAFYASAAATRSYAAGNAASTQYSVLQKSQAGDTHAAKWDGRLKVDLGLNLNTANGGSK
jgi:hypothetical protein